MMIRNIIFSLFLVLPVSVAVASTVSLIEQRQQFLLAEKLIQKGEDSLFLNKLETLKDYTLYPYLQYQWLKNNLDQEKKIKIFLRYYKDTRYAGLLKYKWQYYLAKNKKWKEFVKQYVHSSDKKLQCYYYRAMYNTGAKKGALIGAKKLWVLGKSQPDECDLIFKVLKTSVYFTRELLWQRFEAAITKGSVRVAEYVKGLMNKKDRGVATFWLKVHANPSLITNQTLFRQQQAQAGLIFAHGVDRLASKSLAKAIRVWDAGKRDFIINAATVQRIEQRLAMSLAYRRDEMAYSRLSNLTKPDEVTKEWRVRTALRERNWGRVEQSIAALNKETKEKEKWRYWQARAAEQNNRPKMSNFIYAKLSKERSYFGYLAAEKLNKGYQLSDNPVVVPPEAYKRLKNKADFRVVAELIAVDKEKEAKRQWWYVIKKSDKKSILAAAKYAQELDWKQVAIYTLAKAKYWDDVGVRFPLAYNKQVHKNARTQQLNPAIIFGLIRRESAFNKNAQSPVGAKGLMQIMPKTGQQIARELKEKWKNSNSLFNPQTNLKYGSYYYKKMLNKFNGHYALAAAAYNAGPHRVKRWLPSGETLAADIWIETIPFKETRAYVSAVLTYALIYQKKLKQNLLTMKDFMRDVIPG